MIEYQYNAIPPVCHCDDNKKKCCSSKGSTHVYLLNLSLLIDESKNLDCKRCINRTLHSREKIRETTKIDQILN